MKINLKNIFSIKNDNVYKIVRFCGLKFKIKSKYNKLFLELKAQEQKLNALSPLIALVKRNDFLLTKGINKDKAAYDFDRFQECGINDNTRTPRIVVSLTSYPGRMYDIHYCLYSLLNQTTKPDEVVLWLAEEEFPNKEADLPQKVLKLKDNGLTIKWCKNTGSYKKLIPALKEYPQDIIVTADDDIYYPSDWLEKLYNSYLENPECISAHRVHKIGVNVTNNIEPYQKWQKCINDNTVDFANFFTGAGGVLYPPDCFYKDVCNEDLFMQLAPKADDVWFWAMCVMNNKKIKVVKNPINEILYINTYRELGINKDESTLFSYNKAGGNDEQIKNVINAYPPLRELLEIFSAEKKNLTDFYDIEFYKFHSQQSYTSAKNILPEVFKIFPDIKSVIDIGCGVGTWLKPYLEYNTEIKICGYDINTCPDEMFYVDKNKIKAVDLNQFCQTEENLPQFDICQCMECAEHLPEESAEKFVKKLAALSDLILFSAAITHQGGTNHLNERPLQYWNELFKKEGFYCFDILREKLWDNPDIEWWYRQNIAIFAKNKALDILKQQGYNETDFLNTYYHPELVKKILSRK